MESKIASKDIGQSLVLLEKADFSVPQGSCFNVLFSLKITKSSAQGGSWVDRTISLSGVSCHHCCPHRIFSWPRRLRIEHINPLLKFNSTQVRQKGTDSNILLFPLPFIFAFACGNYTYWKRIFMLSDNGHLKMTLAWASLVAQMIK